MMGNVVRMEQVKKYYGKEPNIVKALDGVSLTIADGQFVAVVGTSGSGKTTLLHMMGGLDVPTSGKVWVHGEDISGMKPEEQTVFRRRNIGFVFQNFNLIPTLNVYENIVLPVQLDGRRPDKQFAEMLLEALGCKERMAAMPSMLSGGQQQRVAIARALLTKPSIVLADEPTGNLDSKTSMEVLGLLKMASFRFHQTLIMITHNESIAQMADEIIHIEDGHIQTEDAIHIEDEHIQTEDA